MLQDKSQLASDDILKKSEHLTIFLRVGMRLIRATLLASSLLSIVIILILAIFVSVVGERNLMGAFLMYAPLHIFLLPTAVLLVGCLCFYRKLVPVHLVVAGSWVVGVMGMVIPSWNQAAQDDGEPVLRVITHNRGQKQGSTAEYFANFAPDIVAFQEAGRPPGQYLRAYDWLEYGKSIGEYSVLSRFPVVDANQIVVTPENGPSAVVAARFVLDYEGEPLVVYNIHMPTPRWMLLSLRPHRFLLGIVGLPGTPFEKSRKSYQSDWDRQIEIAELLREVINQEDERFLVVGDFNAPSTGVVHRILSKGWLDAHDEAGSWFGYTFPGTTHNPLTLFGPWLRLDRICAGPGWEALHCEVEPGSPAQHRAVAAQLRPVPKQD